ncbi:Sorbitol dehydrogenase [Mizuhopecten yessoensis]|uniref:Sorbitol dehydrogenase n=2 Tax=Mizuhopecten yessoensis TaxID=6573 RepID=A0A210PEV5_MIZYE|nr:Sorbitol dehydrogenase [Mizuhopecten yessoensis]
MCTHRSSDKARGTYFCEIVLADIVLAWRRTVMASPCDSVTGNLAAVLHGKLDIRLEKIAVPELEENEVLLAMGSVGICGSDLKYWIEGKCGIFTLGQPMVMGHEGSGTVARVGPGVKSLTIGDRVAVEPGVPCRKCALCKKGRYNLCKKICFCATPPDDGNLCRYYKHPADFCFKLPDQVSLDEGALLEPLAVAIYSCRRGNVALGTKVLVCGSGPVGILTMLVAKQMGASKVLITDIDDIRLEMANRMGADLTLKVTSDDSMCLAKQIEVMMGGQPEVSIECSGADLSYATAIHATFPGGCVVTVARHKNSGDIPLNHAATKEVDIKGIFRYANCYPAALDFVTNSGVDLTPLITHHFNLMNTTSAFEAARSRDAHAVKVMIHCNK